MSQTAEESAMSSVQPLLSMQPEHLEIVRDIVQHYVPGRRVLAFGSRAGNGKKTKKYSDLDLAVIGNEPLSLSVEASLAEAFDESDLVFKVDVVDWAKTSQDFREVITRSGVVVQAGADV